MPLCASSTHIPPSSCFPERGARRSTYSENSAASRYGRAGVGRRAPERRRRLMGAWCGVGSRPDLRHRPRHRCAVATPASRPWRVSTASGPRQTSRRRSAGGLGELRRRRRSPEANDESTTATAHLSLIACRGSVATSSPTRRAWTSGSWVPGDVATAISHRRRQRPVAPVLGRRDARAGEHDARERPAVDRSLVDCHHLRIQDHI